MFFELFLMVTEDGFVNECVPDDLERFSLVLNAPCWDFFPGVFSHLAFSWHERGATFPKALESPPCQGKNPKPRRKRVESAFDEFFMSSMNPV